MSTNVNSPIKFNHQKSGYVLATALFALIILTLLGITFITFMTNEYKIAKNQKNAARAFYIAEAGLQKAIFEINQTASTYTGETNTNFGGGSFTVELTDNPGVPNSKIITSTAFYPVGVLFPAKRKVRITATAHPSGSSMAIRYAVQIGELGLEMYSNSRINGNVYSNGNITGYSNTLITGDAYAVGTISSPKPEVQGQKYPGSPSQQMPYIDAEFWKAEANKNNDPINGDYELNGESATLGPRKIIGNFRLNSNSSLTLTGPLYVTGNFEMNSNTHLYLDESFGSAGTVVVVDGWIHMNSNSQVHSTSANPKGYILLVSTSTAIPCIELNSNAIGGVYYALNGGIQINSNAHAVAVIGRKLILNSNATLDYDMGLGSSEFTSGPGGGWLQDSKSWQEIY